MNSGERTHFGLVAQDAEETIAKYGYTLNDLAFICRDHEYVESSNEETGIIEKIYQYNEDGTPKYIYGLRYTELIPLNMWQIQKLKNRVSELEDKIKELESKIL